MSCRMSPEFKAVSPASLFSEKLLRKSRLPDHALQRPDWDFRIEVVRSPVDEPDLTIDHSAIAAMACGAMPDFNESVPLYDFQKFEVRALQAGQEIGNPTAT